MDPWLNDQRETPSFSMGLFADRVNSILDAPLPKCLRLKGEVEGEHSAVSIVGSSVRGIVSPRSAAVVTHRVAAADGGRRSPEVSQIKPIHETLLEKGRLAAEQKEAMRLQAIEEELSHLRPAPSIKYAEMKKMSRQSQRVEDRLLLRAREAEERRESEAKRSEEQMLKELSIVAPFRPTISGRGRKATPRARKMIEETQRNWYREREQRREAARTAKLLQDLSEVQDAPAINPRSERLAARRREKEGLSGISAVDALIERDRIAQLKRWERHEMEKRNEQTPQITLYAATLQRAGDAAERLYAESYEKVEQRLRRQQQIKENDTRSFTPRISPRAATTPRLRSVEDELMQRHIESKILREKRRQKEEEQELRRHQPTIDPVSEAIAARLPETSFERLYRQPLHASRGKVPAAVDSSFQWSLNGDSGGGGGRRRCASSLPDSMAEALQSYEECRQRKMRKIQEEQERRQREECTFTPVTNVRGRMRGGPEDVVARNQQWLARREGKLRELRQRKEIEKDKECTFRPERESLTTGPLHGETIYGGDGTPWGVQGYLERQKEARRLKRESEARLQRRPSSAPRPLTTTTPQEFVLGRRGSVPIRSLRRPSHVPLMSPEKDAAPSAFPQQSPRQKEDDLSVYERIYNRVYNTVLASGGDGV